MKIQQERPTVITNAARSPADQYRSRQIRYVSMMGARAACLIIGAILVSVRPPLLPLWAAVLIANDRPPKTKAERNAPPVHHQTMIETQSAETIRHRTIDAEQ